MVADSNAIESHRNRPSTTPSKSRAPYGKLLPANRAASSGFPEIRLRKEPRLGALHKKKIVQKNFHQEMQTANFERGLQRADGEFKEPKSTVGGWNKTMVTYLDLCV